MDSTSVQPTPQPMSDEDRAWVVMAAKRYPFVTIAAFFATIISFTSNFPFALLVLSLSGLLVSEAPSSKGKSKVSKGLWLAASILAAMVAVAGKFMEPSMLLAVGTVVYFIVAAVRSEFVLAGIKKAGKGKKVAFLTGLIRLLQAGFIGFAGVALLGSAKVAVILGCLFHLGFMSIFTLAMWSLLAAVKLEEKRNQDNLGNEGAQVIKGEVTPKND